MKRSIALICSLILVLFFSVSSPASDELGEMEEWELGDVTVGGDIRIQGIATKNVTDLEDDIYKPQEVDMDNSEFLRHRTRVWLDVDLWDDARAYIRLAAEPTWGMPDESLSIDHLIVIDNSYIHLSEMFGTPVSMRFGRQDLAYGEGFLIKEGTPADESPMLAVRSIISDGQGHLEWAFQGQGEGYNGMGNAIAGLQPGKSPGQDKGTTRNTLAE